MISIRRGYLYYIWIPCFFAILLLSGCGVIQPASTQKSPLPEEARQGVLDLGVWDFDKDGNLPLNGEWEFYWNRLLNPEQVASIPGSAPQADIMKLPHAWNGERIHNVPLSGSGYATFHLKVKIMPSNRVLALELPMIRTAYKLWVNGQPLLAVGEVGMTRAESRPQYLPQLLFLPQSGDPTLDTVLQVSNFHQRLGGVWNEITLGEAHRMKMLHNNKMGLDMLLVGSLLLMELYHLGLFLIRFRERSSLYFSLFCLFSGVRTMIVGEGAMYQMFPEIGWAAGMRIEYSCFFLGLPAALMFFRSLYPQETGHRVVRAVNGIGVLFFVGALLVSPWILTWMIQSFQVLAGLVSGYAVICLARAYIHKREGVLFALIGIAVYSMTVGVDIAYYNQWIRYGDASTLGLFYLILMTSFIISLKSSRAFASVETLSRQRFGLA